MRKILVVDDDENIRNRYKEVLSKIEVETFEAPEALDVIDILMRNQSEIEMVLLDIEMPEVNGRDIFDIVTEYAPELPIMVASVLPIADQKLRIPRAREYYGKADGDEVLVSKVKSILGI